MLGTGLGDTDDPEVCAFLCPAMLNAALAGRGGAHVHVALAYASCALVALSAVALDNLDALGDDLRCDAGRRKRGHRPTLSTAFLER